MRASATRHHALAVWECSSRLAWQQSRRLSAGPARGRAWTPCEHRPLRTSTAADVPTSDDADADDPATARLQRLLQGYSVELTPQAAMTACESGTIQQLLKPGSVVSVTQLVGADLHTTIDAAAALKRAGMTPVPHVAVRNQRTLGELRWFIESLVDRAGVDELLVVAGGVDDASFRGEVRDSMQLVASGVLEANGIKRVGFAGHPEGSPDISDGELSAALLDKNEWAASAGAAAGVCAYLVTQFTFDAEPIVRWLRRVAHEGNALPVRVGVPGPAKLRTLVNFARKAGVSAPRILMKDPSLLAKVAFAPATPAEQVVDLSNFADAEAQRDGCVSQLEGLHFYTFGGLRDTVAWADSVIRGQIDWAEDLTRFDVRS